MSLQKGHLLCVEGKVVPGSVGPHLYGKGKQAFSLSLSPSTRATPPEGPDWPWHGGMTTDWANPYGQSEGPL